MLQDRIIYNVHNKTCSLYLVMYEKTIDYIQQNSIRSIIFYLLFKKAPL